MRQSERKHDAARLNVVDKSDRATVEQAIDPRTRMVLFKMLNKGIFKTINGCVSTGKEANVYHAGTDAEKDLAVKVYKTSILAFRDRDRYVSGDYRFRVRAPPTAGRVKCSHSTILSSRAPALRSICRRASRDPSFAPCSALPPPYCARGVRV